MRIRRGIEDAYLDKAGFPISVNAWQRLRDDEGYARVRLTLVEHADISTIWHGVNDGHGRVFESVVFRPNRSHGLVRWVYRDEAGAIVGHNRLVAWWWSWHPPKGLEPKW